MRLELIDELSKEECEEILQYLNHWEWAPRLGKEPFMFYKLERYEKPHNLKYRLECLFRVIWPFTRADYVQPIRHKIFEKYPELNALKNFF